MSTTNRTRRPTVTCPRYARAVAAASGVRAVSQPPELEVELELHDGTCEICGHGTVVAQAKNDADGPSLCVRCAHAYATSTAATATTRTTN